MASLGELIWMMALPTIMSVIICVWVVVTNYEKDSYVESKTISAWDQIRQVSIVVTRKIKT